MKKSLIALAAVAASGAAFAQSSVTLFGTVDANVTVVDGKNSVTAMNNSGLSSSALGFRGVEDLGNGLKAQFWLEGGLSNDDGSGVGGKDASDTGKGFEFKRRSTISLLGNFGEFQMGRNLTAAYQAVSKYDPFGTLGVGASRVWANTIVDVRQDNMLGYYSPSFGGFRINANYAFGEKVEANNNGVRTNDYYGVAATYDNGPLSIGTSYFKEGRAVVGGLEREGWALGAAYDFGVAKLSAAYQTADRDQVLGEGTQKNDATAYVIGLSAPVGAAGTVKFSYNRYQVENELNEKEKANHYSLGYVHQLSKRTAVYGAYSYLKNKGDATFNIANHGNAGLDNGKIQAFQVGVRHSF